MNSTTMALLHAFIFLFLFTASPLNSVLSSATQVSYTDHCGSLVHESDPKRVQLPTVPFVQFHTGYYTGGNNLLNQNSSLNSNSLSFRIWNVFRTEKNGVFEMEGNLMLRSLNEYFYMGNVSYPQPHYPKVRSGRLPYRRSISLNLRGFWSESSGELCMVGSGTTYSREGKLLNLYAVLKLYDLKNSTSVTSLITGTLKSLSSSDDKSYFEPISMLILPRMNYEYTLVSGDGFSGVNDTVKSLPLSSLPRKAFCSIVSMAVNGFTLKYASDCGSTKNCNPFDGVVGYLSSVMSLSEIDCSENEKKMRVMIGFANSSYVGFYQSFNFNTTLVGEGSWDEKNNQLCIVACQFLNITESLASARVGYCSTRISLQFPAVWSIRDTSSIVGQIWSNVTVNESGYFDKIAFQSSENSMVGVPGLKYEYTEIDRTTKLCTKKKPTKNKVERYPNGHSYDMRFDMWAKSSKAIIASGYAVPLSVDDQFYERYLYATPLVNSRYANSVVHTNLSNSSPVNISYKIGIKPQPGVKLDGWLSLFNASSNSKETVEISAEGIYDGKTGSLCMVGCIKLGLNNQVDSMDCEILVNYQFPPLSAKKNGSYIKGTIESTRKRSDPLYFKSLEVSSAAYIMVEAKKSIWRMDLEIAMVLISNTFACVFVALQLFHVKKHPEVLSFISIVMLLILTLGHMIPLVLNFEAMFLQNRDRQNVLLGSGGWLEVNEVIVRVITMVAFLLQVRLLQLTCSSRSGDGNLKDLWFVEKSTLFVSLPFYAAGALISLLVNWRKGTHDVVMLSSRLLGYHQKFFWMDLKSYAGLVLDGFLLPQILLNILRSSKENALSCSFYTGTTLVRLLPHAYDLYRAYNYNDGLYYYAKPGADFYSTAWDVIIPLGCLLFAAIIYLQQRFGGRCMIPWKFRELEAYEQVPVVNEA